MGRISGSGKKTTFTRYATLRHAIAVRNMTIAQAAEIAGCRPTAFSYRMNGTSGDFKVSEAKRLAEYFGMTVEELFKEETR